MEVRYLLFLKGRRNADFYTLSRLDKPNGDIFRRFGFRLCTQTT